MGPSPPTYPPLGPTTAHRTLESTTAILRHTNSSRKSAADQWDRKRGALSNHRYKVSGANRSASVTRNSYSEIQHEEQRVYFSARRTHSLWYVPVIVFKLRVGPYESDFDRLW